MVSEMKGLLWQVLIHLGSSRRTHWFPHTPSMGFYLIIILVLNCLWKWFQARKEHKIDFLFISFCFVSLIIRPVHICTRNMEACSSYCRTLFKAAGKTTTEKAIQELYHSYGCKKLFCPKGSFVASPCVREWNKHQIVPLINQSVHQFVISRTTSKMCFLSRS